jgi:hypothetical protein
VEDLSVLVLHKHADAGQLLAVIASINRSYSEIIVDAALLNLVLREGDMGPKWTCSTYAPAWLTGNRLKRWRDFSVGAGTVEEVRRKAEELGLLRSQ